MRVEAGFPGTVVTATSSGGGELSAAFSAQTGKRTWLASVHLSASTSLSLSVFDGSTAGTLLYSLSVPEGVTALDFPAPLRCSEGNALTVLLSSGGAANSLNAIGFTGA